MITTKALQKNTSSFSVPKDTSDAPLRDCVRRAVDSYFEQLDGHHADSLYELVLCEVELPLLQAVMSHTKGNQSRAAQVLGMSRSTLRKKLKHYAID